MIERICHINSKIDDSIFLLGARQTGKSTFLRQTFPDCTYVLDFFKKLWKNEI